MRKLRRLPWRIPKSHNSSAPSPAPTAMAVQPEPAPVARALEREELNTQPVAFCGGRYVYGYAPSVPSTTQIRRKIRHRTLAIAG